MTPAAEARIRSAFAGLADAVVSALADDVGPPAADRLLSVDDAAAALGIGRSRLYLELNAGRLRSVRSGRRRLVAESAIADFIRSTR